MINFIIGVLLGLVTGVLIGYCLKLEGTKNDL